MIIKIKTNLVLIRIDNGGTAAIQGSSIVFYGFIKGIFVAVTAYRPVVQPCASNGFNNPKTVKSRPVKTLPVKSCLVKGFGPQQITFAIKTIKHVINIGMPDGAVFAIRHQILLADIGCVIAV